MKLALGPILYFWTRHKVYDFYEAMLELPLDIIYLGETVCSKRRELKTADWIELAKYVSASGKQVVLSTLALIEAESELKTLRKICDNHDFLIEANDMAAVQILSEKRLPFVSGPFINIYNAGTLHYLYQQGLKRWVMPVELSKQTLTRILQDEKLAGLTGSLETEVFSYGCLPLAFSARCFTARAHHLAKDDCRFVCRNFPRGQLLQSQEGQAVFTLNGIQVQSGAMYNLLSEYENMCQLGVASIRLSPQAEDMNSVVQQFHAARMGKIKTFPAAEECCNGYWHHKAGMENTTSSQSPTLT